MTKMKRKDLLDMTAQYRDMEAATAVDYAIVHAHDSVNMETQADRVLAHLRLLEGLTQGLHVDVFFHSLQTATRALNDGRDEEYIVCCLLHDIGDTLGVENHAEVGAAILRPYISEKNYWMVKHHGIFQNHHKFAMPEEIRRLREKYNDHPYFDYTAEFCQKYDSKSFDDTYETLPLSAFEDMVRRVFARPWNNNPAFDEIDLQTMKTS